MALARWSRSPSRLGGDERFEALSPLERGALEDSVSDSPLLRPVRWSAGAREPSRLIDIEESSGFQAVLAAITQVLQKKHELSAVNAWFVERVSASTGALSLWKQGTAK